MLVLLFLLKSLRAKCYLNQWDKAQPIHKNDTVKVGVNWLSYYYLPNVQGMRRMTLEPDWSFHMRFQIPRSETGKDMYDWRSIVHTARDLPAVWLTQGKSNMLYISTPINGNDGYVIEPPKPIRFGKWQTLQIGRERVMVCAVFCSRH